MFAYGPDMDMRERTEAGSTIVLNPSEHKNKKNALLFTQELVIPSPLA
jgi:hypothetical protein